MKNLLTYNDYSAARAAITESSAKTLEASLLAAPMAEGPVSAQVQPALMPVVEVPQAPKLDYYTEALLSLIPSPIIGAYVVIDGIVQSGNVDAFTLNTIQWIVFGILLLFTPLYLNQVSKIINTKHLVVSTLAFAVWVFALGGPFESLMNKSLLHLIGSISLVIFTLVTLIFANQIAKK
jgi:hypothetical protein